MTDEPLITSTQAGLILNRSGRTINRMVDAGKLTPAQRLTGPNGAYLFREADVRALLAGKAAA